MRRSSRKSSGIGKNREHGSGDRQGHREGLVDALPKLRMAKSKKNNNKPKLNLTVREEQRSKLEQMASLENRSVSNLIEVMADERWKRLAEQQGVGDAPRL
jgi:hypothetical protein